MIEFKAPDCSERPAFAAALDLLAAAIDAVDPYALVSAHLRVETADTGSTLGKDSVPASDATAGTLICGSQRFDLASIDRIFLIAAGKAAGPMIQAAEEALGSYLDHGVGVTTRGNVRPTRLTMVHEAGHPISDPASLMATRQIAKVLAQTTERDLVICLISGGASALLCKPAGRIPLIDLQSTQSRLLASGASIDEMNVVRKHLSSIKGGGLARMAAPARLASLVLSDVVGNPLATIASGPTVPDPSTFTDAATILSRYGMWSTLADSVGKHLRDGLAGAISETPKAGDPVFDKAKTELIGSNRNACEAAVMRAEALGYKTLLETCFLEGEAREAGRFIAAMGREALRQARRDGQPHCLVFGGETTVTLQKLGGKGGRNQELALSAALELERAGVGAEICIAAMGTDGIDGDSDAAGAIVDGQSMPKVRAAGAPPEEALAGHNSGLLFAGMGDAILCGPSGTNVNDICIVLSQPS